MRFDLSKFGIRHQLWGLFGLFLLTGALVLALDELGQYRAERSMVAMRDDVLAGMARIRRLSDAYSQDVVNTTFRARNYLVSWDDAVVAVDHAQATIDTEWAALQSSEFAGDDRALLIQALQDRTRADRAVRSLRQMLEAKDIRALGRFADRELYPAIDPLAERLQVVARRGQIRADALVQAEITRGTWVSRTRIALSLLCFVLVVLFGRRILRNGYKGVESLHELSQKMVQHDYTAKPHYRPTGELGEVMDSFLRMRGHVQRIETQLTDQLISNDRVRIALERREHFQRLLLEAAQTAIFAVDEDGTFSQINPFAEQMLGWPAGSLLGREKLDAILDPDAVLALSRHLSEAYGQPVLADWTALRALAQHREPPREFVLRHQRGRTLPVLLALSAMRDDTGAMVGLLAVATDLTAIKRLERALRDSEARARDANHAKSSFLAAMSHEIRTPMIGVTGMIEVLSHTQLDTEQRRSLNVIQASAETLLRIIGDILDFSKIEAGRMEIEPVPTSLPDLLRSVVANYAGSASSKGLTLTCEIDPRIAPAYYADPVRVRQVIGNFISNSIKFTEHGSVTTAVELRRHDPADGALGSDALVMRVTDTGIGVSEQAQARLFQPFSQAEVDTTRRFGGTGLGLAISRRIAELMGGDVEMESVPGIGTTMRLLVKLHRAPEEELPEMAAPGRAVSGFNPRHLPTLEEAERERSLVLLVDDHATNRQVIQRQLALAGYVSETADDGIEGLERWRSGRYALLLSDVHMPRMDGYQLAQAIRDEETRRGLPRTPIVALTASALKGEAERCFAAGMDDYMAKPVGIATLGACLQRWLPQTGSITPMPVAQGASIQAANNQRVVAAEAGLPQLVHPPALDGRVLFDLTGGDAADIRALLHDFLTSTNEDLDLLEALRSAGDLQGMTRQSHKIKGAARLVGALELADAAAALESAGRSGDWASVLPLAVDVTTAVERLRLDVAERYPA
ncbi:ATP-binding protein [Thermomonas sp. HDW16]|uniref:ATP-binding protein n=1 Tax=Thermomonas sp. HDW16 TaxID=2714945 RepID=UPI00140DAE50|nr:ATP-binding protein [Thermomonas sp. HDW16]QIL19405.1 response regulator [Thermomonas sp. HDW16]